MNGLFGVPLSGMATESKRLAVSAQAVGIAEAAYREAYQYAQQRIQFGQPINEIHGIVIHDMPVFHGGE